MPFRCAAASPLSIWLARSMASGTGKHGVSLQQRRQRLAIQKLHGHEEHTLGRAAEIEDVDDVGMADGTGGARFALESEPRDPDQGPVSASSVLIATRRPRAMCSASCTTPMAPRPSSRTILYFPSRIWPGASDGSGCTEAHGPKTGQPPCSEE
jgi:hypothetical protein